MDKFEQEWISLGKCGKIWASLDRYVNSGPKDMKLLKNYCNQVQSQSKKDLTFKKVCRSLQVSTEQQWDC